MGRFCVLFLERGKVMKKCSLFILIILLVFFVNNTVVWGYGFATMRTSEKALESGCFNEVLVNQNKYINYTNYKVRNWCDFDLDSNKSSAVMELLYDAKCEKMSPFFTSLVCFFQNSSNSITEIVLRYVDGKELTIPLKKIYLQKTINSLYSGEIVKLFGDYYLIGYFIDGVNIDELFTVAVYRLESSNNLEELYEYKTNNDLYEKSFPEYLSFYINDPLYVCIWYFSVLIESLLIYNFIRLIKNKKTKTKAKKERT